MSPTPFNNTALHAKKESHNMCPSPLKASKDSHLIKKSPSSSSLVNGVAVATTTLPQRHPVIIYTHSPKIIHTHPRHFMALVQKLTGFKNSKEDQVPTKTPKSEQGIDETEENHPQQHQYQYHHQHNNNSNNNNNNNSNKGSMNDDNESTSVITDEHGSNSMGDGQVNSCFGLPVFDPPNPCFNNIPFFTPNSLDLLCSTQPYYNYPDSMFFMPSMRNSISSSTLEGLKEFPEFQ